MQTGTNLVPVCVGWFLVGIYVGARLAGWSP